MKRLRLLVAQAGCAYFVATGVSTIAHEVPVHQRITQAAVKLSTGLDDFATQALKEGNAVALKDGYGKALTATGWIVEGSAREDDVNTDSGGYRSFCHFCNPLLGSLL